MNLTAEPLKHRLQQETGHIQLQNRHARVADVSTVMVFWARRGVWGGEDYEGHKHTMLTLSLMASVLYATSSSNNDNNQKWWRGVTLLKAPWQSYAHLVIPFTAFTLNLACQHKKTGRPALAQYLGMFTMLAVARLTSRWDGCSQFFLPLIHPYMHLYTLTENQGGKKITAFQIRLCWQDVHWLNQKATGRNINIIREFRGATRGRFCIAGDLRRHADFDCNRQWMKCCDNPSTVVKRPASSRDNSLFLCSVKGALVYLQPRRTQGPHVAFVCWAQESSILFQKLPSSFCSRHFRKANNPIQE